MNPILPKDQGLAFPRTLKRKKSAKRASKPESVTQELVEVYCHAIGLETFHMPAYVLNAAFGWKPNRTGAEFHAMKEASQEVKGLPDLLIFDSKRPGRLIAIELKTEIGKMTAFQKIWQQRLGTTLCRSFESAKQAIDNWILLA